MAVIRQYFKPYSRTLVRSFVDFMWISCKLVTDAEVAKLAIRKRLKIVRRNPCGFDSRLRHYKNNMSRRYKPRKVQFFDWSSDLAYAVGLIATDGCLSSNQKNVTFTSKDIEQIGNIKLILKMNAKIGMTKNSTSDAYRLQFSSTQFWDWLVSIGLTPHKSLTIGELKIPIQYFIDFLRGHLDGDGSIMTYTDRYNAHKNPNYVYERLWVKFISASETHMIWLQNMIIETTGIPGRLHKTKPNHAGNHMYILKFAKKASLTLLSKIYYSDALPCLTRKKSIYRDFLVKMREIGPE